MLEGLFHLCFFSLAGICLSPQNILLCSAECHVLSGSHPGFISTFLCLQTHLIFTDRAVAGFSPQLFVCALACVQTAVSLL